VTEFSSGCELLDEILNREAFKEQETFFIVKQILQTLQYCHQFNICHRDIKPENIMLEENLQVKIIDFGTACQFNPGVGMKKTVGTYLYMAPEVIVTEKTYNS
jgi:serine/threonine protein kinase